MIIYLTWQDLTRPTWLILKFLWKQGQAWLLTSLSQAESVIFVFSRLGLLCSIWSVLLSLARLHLSCLIKPVRTIHRTRKLSRIILLQHYKVLWNWSHSLLAYWTHFTITSQSLVVGKKYIDFKWGSLWWALSNGSRTILEYQPQYKPADH